MESKHIFGPILSRRFGISLGIDPFPNKKICNFDCLYCEIPHAEKSDGTQEEHVPPETILAELESRLKTIQTPDVLTITANGEPTLYKHLDILIAGINGLKEGAKSLILSNGSTIMREEVRRSLAKLDIVKLSLDSVEQKVFRKIDRAIQGIEVEEILRGMAEFRRIYKGELVIEILLAKGCNDSLESAKLYKKYLEDIKPDRIDIGTIHRPPAFAVERVETDTLEAFAAELGVHNILIAAPQKSTPKNEHLSKEEFLNTLAKRPLCKDDLEALFDTQTIALIETMEKRGEITKKSVGNIDFFSKIP